MKGTREFVLAIDQGTTGSTAIVVDTLGRIVGLYSQDFPQIFPQSGWVEHNPEDIWRSIGSVVTGALKQARVKGEAISAIGITNQRETTVAWDGVSGKPVYNAIVWQCRRTTEMCESLLRKRDVSRMIKKKTGLVIDPYFSATKIAWILRNVDAAKRTFNRDKLKVGTIDSFILWRLTGGQSHKTEVSNASRTMLMDLQTLNWDPKLLKVFGIPEGILPTIEPSDRVFGTTRGLDFLPDNIPISGILGDQHAALFGQACFKPGDVKCTYGTGSFILMNTGSKIVPSKHGMLTTVAWKLGDRVTYALEGGAFVCGAAVQWLRDGLGIIQSSDEIEALARKVSSSEGVEFVPALTGLGAPYWKPEARGIVTGLTRGTTKAHLARTTLEAMALQNVDIMGAMEKDLGKRITRFRVDGGATVNNLLMQIQADYLGLTVTRPKITETTAYGASLIAGLGVGVWKDIQSLSELWRAEQEFKPGLSKTARKMRLKSWHRAISRAIDKN